MTLLSFTLQLRCRILNVDVHSDMLLTDHMVMLNIYLMNSWYSGAFKGLGCVLGYLFSCVLLASAWYHLALSVDQCAHIL